MRRTLFIALMFALALSVVPAPQAQTMQNPIPIPQQPDARSVPEFIGNPATVSPITAPTIPQNPYMAPNGLSNTHVDAYMSDTYGIGGPIGKTPVVLSSFLASQSDPAADCITVAFDSKGLILASCGGVTTTTLYLIDPTTLATLASLALPSNATSAAGVYFYLDNNDRVVVPIATNQIWIVTEGPGPSLVTERVYDLSSALPQGDWIMGVLPDFTGRLWIATYNGLVATLDQFTGRVLGTQPLLGEMIINSFAVDETGGVFIASDHAMYRFDATADGQPSVTWREAYDRGTHVKPGQYSQGTGTTPTLMGSEYVTITDNAEPQMHVLVYQRGRTAVGPRLVCAEPVFKQGTSANENSLVATDKSIIIENNFGFTGADAVMHGRTTAPGLTRIDLDSEGGCHTVWTNRDVSIPNVASKMSLANGLFYTLAKPKGPANTDAWYFTAIDFNSGNIVFQRLTGTGFYYGAPADVYLGPDGKTAYVGVLGGLVSIRDQH